MVETGPSFGIFAVAGPTDVYVGGTGMAGAEGGVSNNSVHAPGILLRITVLIILFLPALGARGLHHSVTALGSRPAEGG